MVFIRLIRLRSSHSSLRETLHLVQEDVDENTSLPSTSVCNLPVYNVHKRYPSGKHEGQLSREERRYEKYAVLYS